MVTGNGDSVDRRCVQVWLQNTDSDGSKWELKVDKGALIG